MSRFCDRVRVAWMLGVFFLVASFSPLPATAGQCAGGALLFHANPALSYTSDVGNYTGLSALPGCAEIVARTDRDDPVVIHLLAVFAPDSHPCLGAVSFAIDYDPNALTLVDSGHCGTLEISEDGWPAPGFGSSLSLPGEETRPVTEIYWFAAYASTPTLLRVTRSRIHGAQFADCATPANVDDVELLGAFGFHQDGFVPCPTLVQPVGACCARGERCWMTSEGACTRYGGSFHGEGSTCDPSPCEPIGACCVPRDGLCTIDSESYCVQRGGTFLGDGASCQPDPCPPIPGGCCLRDGSCAVLSATDCNEARGLYLGPDSSCDPNPCSPPAIGACCQQDGSCLLLDEYSCTQRGTFLGGGSSCEPSPCVDRGQLPGERDTRGKVTRRYR